VYSYGGKLVMLYQGGSLQEMGVALSMNGVDWEKLPRGNPVLTRGMVGSWDEGFINCVAVLLPGAPGGDFKMWYTAGAGNRPFQVRGRDDWPGAPAAVLVGLAFSSLTGACCKGPSTIEFDQVKLELAPGAELLPPEPPPEGVEITWDLTRGDLKAGVTYEIAIDSGDLHFIAGEDGIAVAGESRVHLAPPACERFRRGDVDGDGAASITDPVLLLSHLFLGGAAPACPDAADADDSGVLDLTDAIYDLDWQFLGGPAPPAPGPDACGSDPTAEDPPLGSCAYDSGRC
jgi:hypothetical protein